MWENQVVISLYAFIARARRKFATAFALLLLFIIPWAGGFFSPTFFHGW
jgi:hypothetical protein